MPLIRRTFATFSALERQQMGERVQRCGERPLSVERDEIAFDVARGDRVLPLVLQLLGLEGKHPA